MKTWNHVSYCWFFGAPNLKHHKITNWDWKKKSLVRILVNLKRCCLQSNNLKKLTCANKNWLNDLRIYIINHISNWWRLSTRIKIWRSLKIYLNKMKLWTFKMLEEKDLYFFTLCYFDLLSSNKYSFLVKNNRTFDNQYVKTSFEN